MTYTVNYVLTLGQSGAPGITDAPGEGGLDSTATPAAEGTTGTTGQPAPTTQGSQAPKSFMEQWGLMILMGVVLVGFFIFMSQGQRKEKKRRQEMLNAIGKNSKVQTVGGIIGIVMEVNDNDVILKVDESSNTRMRFSRAAISNVLDDKKKED